MDQLDSYRRIIESIFGEYPKVRYAYGDIHNETVFDRQSDRYLVVSEGWEGNRRIHGILIHIDIIDGKLWIHRDGTEGGIANRLVEAGVAKDRIVLAFYTPETRQAGEFAVA